LAPYKSEQAGQDVLDDFYWMRVAIEHAKQSGKDVPVGCIIVQDDNVVGSGWNQREASGDPTGHAEIVALREAAETVGSWRLNGTTLYTTLEPCPMCAEAIIQSRVSKVLFGAYDPASGAAGSAFNLFVPGRIFPIPEVIGGMLEGECRELLIDFFRSRPSA
jgi:tRNA(adenine34) deaminase